MDEALELRREHHVHEQKAQQEGDDEIRVRFGEHLRPANKLVAVTRWQIERLHEVVHQFDAFAERQSLEVSEHDDLPLPSVAVDGRRTLGRFEPREAR